MSSLETTSGTSSSSLGVTYSIDSSEFVAQLWISVPIGLVLMTLFCVVRQISLETWEVRRSYSQNDNSVTYPRISTGFIRWVWEIWTMDTNTFYKHAGFDALVFRLYLKCCVYICVAALPYALCVLLPVYGTSENVTQTTDPLSVFSLNTVSSGSGRLYAAVIGCYIFTFIALYYLSKVYLIVAYATDQFLIGSNRLNEIDKLSWFNYKAMIDDIVDVNVNIARAPIDFGGDMISKVKGYVVKKQLVRQPSDEDVQLQHLHDNDVNDNNVINVNEDDNDDDDDDNNVIEADADHKYEEKTELLSENDYSSDAVRGIQNSIPSIDRYTIMIRNLPQPFREEQTLKQFIDRLFPNKVAKVIIIPDVRELSRVQNEIKFHEKALKKLSKKHKFDVEYLHDNDSLPVIYERSHCCGCCGEEINVITYHRTNLDALMSRYNKIKREGLISTPTAFVTFNCLKATSIAISCPIRFGVSNLKIQKAPDPKDLYWDNLKYATNDLIPYNLLVAIAMFFLLIFWSIPVAAIQGLANLESIFKVFDSDVYHYFNEGTVSWLQGSLTVLILDLWLQLIPVIVELLTKIQKKTHRGRLEMVVMTKYYDCLVFMVLLVTVITGTTVSNAENFAGYAKNIISSMSTIINQLADGLSNMSVYFMLYVLLNTWIWLPLELFRPSYHFKKKFGMNEANRFDYSVWFAKTMLILTIILTYAVMSPFMWILGLIYFVLATFVFTYNLSMSWIPEFETGAKQWPLVFGRLRFGFMISIFTMVGLMALKQAYIQAALLVPLAGFIWYTTGSIAVKFRPVFSAPSLTSATDKDRQINKVINRSQENGTQQFGDLNKLNTAYLPPIMCIRYPSHSERVSKMKEKKNKEDDDSYQNI